MHRSRLQHCGLKKLMICAACALPCLCAYARACVHVHVRTTLKCACSNGATKQSPASSTARARRCRQENFSLLYFFLSLRLDESCQSVPRSRHKIYHHNPIWFMQDTEIQHCIAAGIQLMPPPSELYSPILSNTPIRACESPISLINWPQYENEML